MSEEVKKNTKKDNKTLKLVLKIIIFLLIIMTIVCLSIFAYKFILIKNILDNNVEVYLGNNYKLINIHENPETGEVREEIVYYKDGRAKKVNGDAGISINEDDEYYFMLDKMQYYKRTNDMFPVRDAFKENVNLFMYYSMNKEDVDTIQELFRFYYTCDWKFGTKVVDGTEYIVITNVFIGSPEKEFYIDKETYRCVWNQDTWQRVEIGTVTDEDLKMPWELGMTEWIPDNKQKGE